VPNSLKLNGLDDVSEHWPESTPLNRKHLHVIVELPTGKRCVHRVSEIPLTVSRLSSTYSSLFATLVIFYYVVLDHGLSSSTSETLVAVTSFLWDAITMKATAQGDIGGPAALEPNGIFELHGSEPDFVMEFRTKLGKQRWIGCNTTVCFLFFRLHTFLVIEIHHSTLRFCSRKNYATLT
jgi:hypothetical protein